MRLPTRQNGVENRDKVHLNRILTLEKKKLFSVPISKLKRVETINLSKHPEMTNVANIEFFKINIFSEDE